MTNSFRKVTGPAAREEMADVSEPVPVFGNGHVRRHLEHLWRHKIRLAIREDAQHQDHRGRLRAVVAYFVSSPDTHRGRFLFRATVSNPENPDAPKWFPPVAD